LKPKAGTRKAGQGTSGARVTGRFLILQLDTGFTADFPEEFELD
jgi:hypothetical protein